MGGVQMDSDIPLVVDEPEDDLLNPEQSQRLKILFDLQDQCSLTDAQQGELDALVDAYGRALNERGMSQIAQRRGISIEQVRAEITVETDRALAWWQEAQRNPTLLEKAVHQAREAQQTRARG